MDVTVPTEPSILWRIDNNTADFSELGQTWSTPTIGKLESGQLVAIFGAGYDPDRDFDVTPDLEGRGVFMVDVFTGTLVWKYTVAEDPNMDSSIPSDISAIDINDNGYLDRLYVGDLSGRIWRFDIIDPDPLNFTGKIVFSGESKVFYPPDVLLEKDHEILIWGTGDRANPKRKDIFNRIYMVRDRNTNTLTEANLVDVTDSSAEAVNGWYIRLNQNLGEKVLSPAITIFGISYLTTFTPSGAEEFDPCYLSEGTARLFALDYKTGSAVIDFDEDPERTPDRSKIIGTSIPSGLVIAIITGDPFGFAGVSGGIFSPTIANATPIIRIYWRELF
jgi:type IV pilus assembly protein PilY1